MRCGPTNGVRETLTDPSLRQGGLDLLKVVLAIRDERFQIPQQGVSEDLPLGRTPGGDDGDGRPTTRDRPERHLLLPMRL